MRRLRMTKLLDMLQFPSIWKEHDLYPPELRDGQAALLADKTSDTVSDSEHYRYAAFCHYVKSDDTTPEQLHLLVIAASKDPESSMAQAALIDLVSHPRCTQEIYDEAVKVFRGFQEHHFSEDRLSFAYREKIPSWKH